MKFSQPRATQNENENEKCSRTLSSLKLIYMATGVVGGTRRFALNVELNPRMVW